MLNYLKEILYILGDDKAKLLAIIILFFSLSMLELIGIGLIAPYIALVVDAKSTLDGVLGQVVRMVGLPNNAEQLLLYLGVMLVSIFLIKTILSIWINSVIVFYSNNQQVKLSNILMKSYQSLDYIEYINRNSSEYVHGINNLSSDYASILLLLLRSLSNLIISIVIIIFLVWQTPLELLLLIVITASFIYGYDVLFKEKVSDYGRKTNKYTNHILKTIHESMDGFKEIRVLGKEKYFRKELLDGQKNNAFYLSKSQIISTIPRYALELLLMIFIVLLVVISLFFGGDLKTLAPTLAVFGVAALKLLPAANSLSTTLTVLRGSRHSISILYDDIQNFDKSKDKNVKEYASNINNEFNNLTLNKIGFSYTSKNKELNDISLEIKKGESIGFMGQSGSGKTTLVDIILGLLKPDSGSISYNGIDLNKSLHSWLLQVAYLPQQVFLIDDTLRSNIALGLNEEDIDNKKIFSSLKQASLLEFVESIPSGIHTIVGDKGIRLSGGQRQRIALARAFYHNRNVLIMDESTSALDNETEREVVNEIKRLKNNKTTIVIAHRMSTLQYCDRIYKVDKGRISLYK